ncbi:hypothetical protein [Bacteroides sp.]|uniref:hypothetical protein n=1 Tax=Bacteroides sp. TaxID=29523 RepID=UPI0025B9BEA2|nr:hypothetical protein [Bacteroides sp.]
MNLSKIILIISVSVVAMLMFSCERDLNKDVDYYSPQADIAIDTFEVDRDQTIEIKALVKDDSGIAYLTLEYAGWNLKDEQSFDEAGRTSQYEYVYSVKVPSDALFEWEEVYTKHDGTKFIIKQRYHKLSLTCYDGVKNKTVFYFYVKVK